MGWGGAPPFHPAPPIWQEKRSRRQNSPFSPPQALGAVVLFLLVAVVLFALFCAISPRSPLPLWGWEPQTHPDWGPKNHRSGARESLAALQLRTYSSPLCEGVQQCHCSPSPLPVCLPPAPKSKRNCWKWPGGAGGGQRKLHPKLKPHSRRSRVPTSGGWKGPTAPLVSTAVTLLSYPGTAGGWGGPLGTREPPLVQP